MEHKEGGLNMEFEIIQKSRYLQDIGKAYIFQFQCLRCLSLNTGLLNKQLIDKELESKETYEIENSCKICKRRFKIEFSKKIEYIIKEG